MWKHLNLEYKAVLNCFTLSGMHLSNFFEFCIGRHEWKTAEHFFRQQDEARKATDHLIKQQEEVRKAA